MSKFNPLVLGIVGTILLAPCAAQASIQSTLSSFFGLAGDRAASTDSSASPLTAARRAPVTVTPADVSVGPHILSHIEMPSLAFAKASEPPPPSIEKPLRKLFCVEYARARSGLAVFGDAKHWWARAKNLYTRMAHPVENAVMVFSGSKRLKRGHVAVVTHIVSNREIRVDQANWENHGEIDHATPVLDVSAKNDWSRVRVWNMASGGFGTHIYPVSGFILKDLTRQALND